MKPGRLPTAPKAPSPARVGVPNLGSALRGRFTSSSDSRRRDRQKPGTSSRVWAPAMALVLAACSNDATSTRPLCPVAPIGTVPYRTLDGHVLRWKRIECIDVFLDPALSPLSGPLTAATRSFESLSCSELCFRDVASSPAIGVALHPDDALMSTGAVSLEFNARTGTVQRAEIRVNSTHPDFVPLLVTHWLGLALGLDRTAAESIMNAQRVTDGSVSGLTPLDEDAFCGLYRLDC